VPSHIVQAGGNVPEQVAAARQIQAAAVAGGHAATIQQYAVVHQHTRAAVVLLDWLTTQNLTLATCRQADLERWLISGDASHRNQAGHFVRWSAGQRLTTLSFSATRWHGPTQVLDEQGRWETARRLLRDTIGSRDRLAGLLVLLYAQPVARTSRLTTSQISIDSTTVRIRLGPAPSRSVLAFLRPE
jgi:hypothetical protein